MEKFRKTLSKENVKQLQELLTQAGYATKIDGKFKEATRRSLMDFQFDYGLIPDGDLSESTWNALLKSQPRLKVLSKGAKSTSVLIVQQLLNKLGYSLQEDGVFGKKTRNAVKDFQLAHSLDADGVVGPVTWESLLDKTARVVQSAPISPKKDMNIEYKARPTWDEITNTRIETLHPLVRSLFYHFINRVEKELGIQLRVTSAFRSFKEQNQLYAKGRTLPGRIVTYATAGKSYHNYGLAVDVVEIKDGVALWDNPKWKDIADIGRSLGLEWGGDWITSIDKPHFQYSFGLSTRELRDLYITGKKDGNFVHLNS
jgi:peptidoglycan L-alanyl-D-glutamate endopeptidase CwlK